MKTPRAVRAQIIGAAGLDQRLSRAEATRLTQDAPAEPWARTAIDLLDTRPRRESSVAVRKVLGLVEASAGGAAPDPKQLAEHMGAAFDAKGNFDPKLCSFASDYANSLPPAFFGALQDAIDELRATAKPAGARLFELSGDLDAFAVHRSESDPTVVGGVLRGSAYVLKEDGAQEVHFFLKGFDLAGNRVLTKELAASYWDVG